MLKSRKPGAFYGWYIVLAGVLLSGAGIGIFVNCLGTFIKPVCESLGFDRGQFSLYQTIMSLVALVMMPYYGEKFRGPKMKQTVILGAIVCSAAQFGFSFSTQVWQFYVLAFIYGIFSGGVSMMAVGTLINNWFDEKKGLASGIAYSGSGILAMVTIPIVSKVIEIFGWQWGYRLLGTAGFIILMLTGLFLIVVNPEDIGQKKLGDERKLVAGSAKAPSSAVGVTRAEAVKSLTFWALAGALIFGSFSSMAMQPHTVAYLTDIGKSTAFASSIYSLLMGMMVVGKIGMGSILDRFGTNVGSVLCGITYITASIMSLLAPTVSFAPYIYAIAMGGCSSVGTVAGNYFTSTYFGNKEFSRIYSLISMAGSLGVAFGSPTSGFIYDLTGSYRAAWMLVLATGTLAMTLFITASFSSRKLKLTAGDPATALEGESLPEIEVTGAAPADQAVK